MRDKQTIDARHLEAGQSFAWRGQVYFVLGKRPYQRQDARWTNLMGFGSWCATCGEWFEFSVSARARTAWLNRRCAVHKSPGRKVPHARRIFD